MKKKRFYNWTIEAQTLPTDHYVKAFIVGKRLEKLKIKSKKPRFFSILIYFFLVTLFENLKKFEAKKLKDEM